MHNFFCELLQMKNFVFTFGIDIFCMHQLKWQLLLSLLQLLFMQSCSCQLLYAPLQWTTFVCPILIDNFCRHHCYWQLLYALLLLVIFVCTISIQNNFCMYYINWKRFCSNITIDNLSYTIINIYFLCVIATDNCCMLYSNFGIF